MITEGIEHAASDAVIEIEGHKLLISGRPYCRTDKDPEVRVTACDSSKASNHWRRHIQNVLTAHFWDEYGYHHANPDPVVSAVEWLFEHFFPDRAAKFGQEDQARIVYVEEEYHPEWLGAFYQDKILTTEGIKHLLLDAIIEINGHKLVIFYGGGIVRACDRSPEARRLRSLIQADLTWESNQSPGYNPDPSAWAAEQALAKYGTSGNARLVYEAPMQKLDPEMDY